VPWGVEEIYRCIDAYRDKNREAALKEVRVRCPTLNDLPPPQAGRTGWPWTEDSMQLPDKMPDGCSWPRVSIVTPSYNQAAFIEETIRSVLLQGYPDLEYIIIDGGSSDESVQVIRKYESWLSYWVTEPDRGQTHAINKGWMRATGDILAYINTDDCYLTGTIGTAAGEFCARPDVAMVYGAAAIIDVAGKQLRTWDAQPYDLKSMLTTGSVIPQPATFFAKAAINQLGYLSEQWDMIMDYEFCIRIATQYPVACLPKTLARFRDHPQSKTRRQFESMVKEVLEFLSTFSPNQRSASEWPTIKRATSGRLHHELALYYAIGRRQDFSMSSVELLRSFVIYPQFTLKHPLLTSYISRKIAVGYLKVIGTWIATLMNRTGRCPSA
jgi:glycosyltransferase involved in cell wall biosynthesis